VDDLSHGPTIIMALAEDAAKNCPPWMSVPETAPSVKKAHLMVPFLILLPDGVESTQMGSLISSTENEFATLHGLDEFWDRTAVLEKDWRQVPWKSWYASPEEKPLLLHPLNTQMAAFVKPPVFIRSLDELELVLTVLVSAYAFPLGMATWAYGSTSPSSWSSILMNIDPVYAPAEMEGCPGRQIQDPSAPSDAVSMQLAHMICAHPFTIDVLLFMFHWVAPVPAAPEFAVPYTTYPAVGNVAATPPGATVFVTPPAVARTENLWADSAAWSTVSVQTCPVVAEAFQITVSLTYSIARTVVPFAVDVTVAPDPAGADCADTVSFDALFQPRGPLPVPLSRGSTTRYPSPPDVSVRTPRMLPVAPDPVWVTSSPLLKAADGTFVPIGIFIVDGPCMQIQAPTPEVFVMDVGWVCAVGLTCTHVRVPLFASVVAEAFSISTEVVEITLVITKWPLFAPVAAPMTVRRSPVEPRLTGFVVGAVNGVPEATVKMALPVVAPPVPAAVTDPLAAPLFSDQDTEVVSADDDGLKTLIVVALD
jgi:hypothetical protein